METSVASLPLNFAILASWAPSLKYAKETGYGFEPGASPTTVKSAGGDAPHRGAITAAQPFLFSVAVPEGNDRVSVTLGDPTPTSTAESTPPKSPE